MSKPQPFEDKTITRETEKGESEINPTHKLYVVKAEPDPEQPITRHMIANTISIDELYPATEAIGPDLATALRLLADSLKRIDDAIEALKAHDIISADDSIQHLKTIMPELFCCRSLGDGYGAIINAIMCALENLQGKPLSASQILSIGQRLKHLRSEPFIQFAEALDEIEELEKVDLIVTPAEFEYLADWLDGESFY
jgi:hypothetical protein